MANGRSLCRTADGVTNGESQLLKALECRGSMVERSLATVVSGHLGEAERSIDEGVSELFGR